MRIFRKLAQLLDVDLETTAPSDGDSLTFDSASSKWVPEAVSGGGGADDQTAAEVPFTPAGTIAATDTQSAVEEVATDAAAAVTALSSVYQPLDSDLTSIAALTTTSFGRGLLALANQAALLSAAGAAAASHVHAGEDITSGTVADARIASTIARDSEVTSAISALSSVYQAKDTTLDTYAGIDPSANVQSVLGAADYAAIRTLLGLVIGTNVQAYDADLTTWAGLTPSAFFQTLVDDADAATARATLGVIASLFQSGGAQAIKLDDLDAPDDNTDLNVSTSKHGLAPKLPNDATKYLDGTGAYTVPAGGSSGLTVISDQALGADATSIDFTSIAGTYKTLLIEFQLRAADNAARNLLVRLNNDSGSNYARFLNTVTTAGGAVNGVVSQTSFECGGIDNAGNASGGFGAGELRLPFYAGALKKAFMARNGPVDTGTAAFNSYSMSNGVWNSTAAITRVTLICSTGNFLAGSRAILYGIG